jgi:hypothetical protein
METKISKYQVLQTGRYNGNFQIMQGWVGNNGFKPDFISKKQKDGTAKTFPASITFESDQAAVEFFLFCLKDITGKEYAEKTEEAPF